MKTTRTHVVVRSAEGVKQVPVDPEGMTLGRGSECDIVLNDDLVSRAHAKLYQDPFGRWIIEDLNSHNGVFVEGQRVVGAQALSLETPVNIHPFVLTLVQQVEQQIDSHPSANGAMSTVAEDATDVIVSKTEKERPLIKYLNEITEHLLQLDTVSDLYYQAARELAGKFDALVTVVRLPARPTPLPNSLEVLACQVGATANPLSPTPNIHMSHRVLDTVRTEGAAVMARSVPCPDQLMTLTIVDVHSPHVVFSAPVTDISQTVDALYLETLEEKTTPDMFEFIEAVARQIDFVRRSLLFRQRERMAAIGQTMSGLAHCIKNVLNGIRSGSAVLELAMESEDLARVRGGWQTVARNNEMLGTLVLDILALARDSKPRPFPTDVNDLGRQVCELMRARATERDISLTYSPATELTEAKLDPTHFYRCLLNLVSNAVDACRDGGHVGVSIHRGKQRPRFTVSVTDNGEGISDENRHRLFDDFFTTKGGGGTGLGLPVTKKLITEMGGTITFHTVCGHGTRFVFALPVPD